ncbi:MAG: biotin-dependent carboxylase-like uncharacterized protein [Porticoccaceae bacterium]|jgi:biotin-dependent carboxylase-like uncharacterized protein
MADAQNTGLLIKQITPLCQLQDLGRFGYKNYGVTHCGAIDPYNLRVANILVGNKQGTACLEFTLLGAEFVVTVPSIRIAFVGDFPVSVNGEARDNFCSSHLNEGDTLTIGAASQCIRGYLAVAGGFFAKKELGSYSTHMRSGLGGFHDPMQASVTLPTNNSFAASGREYYFSNVLRREENDSIRVVSGPQSEHFTKQGIDDFYAKPFSISNDSDRMGYRLENNVIEHAGDGNIISDPTVPGSIQVPASGNPVVLMADCPTTGGYPKIATITTVDRGLLAQKGPGSEVKFEAVSVQRAQSLMREQEAFFSTLNLRLDCY